MGVNLRSSLFAKILSPAFGLLILLPGTTGGAPTTLGITDEDVREIASVLGGDACLLYVRDVWGCDTWHDVYGNPEAWTNEVRQMVSSPDGARLYVVGHPGYPYHQTFVRALDAATGVTLWGLTFGAYQGMVEINSVAVSPDGAHLYIGGMWDPDSDWHTPSRPAVVMALDSSTGATEWTREWAGPLGYVYAGAAMVLSSDGSTLFLAGTAQVSCPAGICGLPFLLAYSSQDGSLLYQRDYDAVGSFDFFRTITLDDAGGRVIVTFSSGWLAFVRSISMDSGDELWTTELVPSVSSFTPISAPVVNAARGLLHTALAGGTTVALRLADGSIAWTDETPTGNGPVSLNPDGTGLFTMGGQGTLYRYDAASGSIDWQIAGDPNHLVYTILSGRGDDRVYVAGCEAVPEGRAITRALDASTGAELWRAAYMHEASPPILLAPICSTLLHLSPDGTSVIAAGMTAGSTSSSANGYHRDAFLVAYPTDPHPTFQTVPEFALECQHKENGRDKTQCEATLVEMRAECKLREDVTSSKTLCKID